MAVGGFFRDDAKLHKLCHEGNLDKVKNFVSQLDHNTLKEKLVLRKGFFGYTPLHEAAASGKYKVLDYLLERTGDELVNCRASGGFTPLHIAASSGHLDCVRTLLYKSADISVKDDNGRTPIQTAELSNKARIVRMLYSEELVKEVEANGERVTELLRKNTDCLEWTCLNRSLMAATKNDNHLNIGKLVVKGANNLDDGLAFAVQENKPHARAILLLIKAAFTGDCVIIKKLFGETVDKVDDRDHCSDPGFDHAKMTVLLGKVSTVVPIEIARRNGNLQVREELLLKTDVNEEEGYVYWHGLRLLQLEVSWLRRISWVKRLRLARNGFKTLPNDMGNYLKQVVKLDLQRNELRAIPNCLLQLPSLKELNLAHNYLQEIPNVLEWSACLIELILSHNHLSSLPLNVVAQSIQSLDLSHNSFHTVPLCICSFVTLDSLNLSDNPDIRVLPVEMGRLRMLSRLNLTNLKDLKDPPKNLQMNTRDCISYLDSKFRCPKEIYRMKVMLVGPNYQGKTTLLKQLLGPTYSSECTMGVEVSEWKYKPSFNRKPFHFNIWDFRGHELHHVIYQCFLAQRSLYLLVFNLMDGNHGIQELEPWLNTIALRAPHSRIIIVGTHLDQVAEEKRMEIDALLQRVDILAKSYSTKLQIVEIIPVGLQNRIENMLLLKNAIYSHAANYKTKSGQDIMGQKIPASYLALDKKLESVQQEVRLRLCEPIMHSKEFNAMVQQMNLADIQDKEELKMAILFLTDIGSLLHYDDRSHNLHDLYFIDPSWLYNMISQFITANPFVKNGILYSEHIPLLFQKYEFPWKYLEQFLTLLDRFEIALPLDNRRMIIPNMLPEDKPKELIESHFPETVPVYSRYISFNSVKTHTGFWSRLLSKIMYSISCISFALDKIRSSSLVKEPTSVTKTQFMSQLKNPTVQHKFSQPLASATGDIARLIPNFPNSLPYIVEQFDATELCLKYWRYGLLYKDPKVSFCIESLAKSGKLPSDNNNDGVLIMTSYNNHGKKIMGQLVDLVLSLINEWYPELAESHHFNNNLEQRVPCFECVKARIPNPFEFRVDQCLSSIMQKKTTIKCGHYKDDSSQNHTVTLADIVPDLLLLDIDPQFQLNPEGITCAEDYASLLGEGSFGTIHHGTYQNKSVAIKKYLVRNEEALVKLRSEAKLLEQFTHPCLVSLVGVSIYPTMILVLEEAPLKSLDDPLLNEKTPIHRLTIFRIAAEVVAALDYLHAQGIIFRNLNAANVLLWTLDPTSLCHCKVTDFRIATHMAPVGARGLEGTKSFIAPEVLHIGKQKQRSVYGHMADIFSFGMFLYQMIARRHPYHDIPDHKINVLVERGVRPKLQDVYIAQTGYHYLTMLMKKCWEDNPQNRPKADAIIKAVSNSAVQSVMCVFPAKSKLSLRQAISLTPADFIKAGALSIPHNELWVCCDGAQGAELNIYNMSTMVNVSKNFIKDNQVQCMALCNDHVWVGSRAGIEYGVIDIFNIVTRELVHNIRMRENSVSCMVAAKDRVIIGTLEGYCFSFTNDIESVRQNTKPRYQRISEHAVDGIVSTVDCIWISHTQHINFLNSENLNLEGSISRDQNMEAYIGQLSLAPAKDVVWSAHLGGIIVTAWDANNRSHMFDIDTFKVLQNIAKDMKKHVVITAMVLVLDMLWVGMATGHVLLFHQEELLTWYHPYTECVRFLTVIPRSGPCETEDCVVVSGGKGFDPLFHKMGSDFETAADKMGQPSDMAGVLVMWEGFSSKMIRQINLVAKKAPYHLETHSNVKQIIQTGEFLDGTGLVGKS